MFNQKYECEIRNILDEFLYVIVDCEDLNGMKKKVDVWLDTENGQFSVVKEI